MARQIDFEEWITSDHPDELRALARAVNAADEAMGELDELVNRAMGGEGPLTVATYAAIAESNRELMALALDAWKLRNALRDYGMLRLAAWEAAQQPAEMAEADECPKCGGRGYEEIGPLRLDCDACAGTGMRDND